MSNGQDEKHFKNLETGAGSLFSSSTSLKKSKKQKDFEKRILNEKIFKLHKTLTNENNNKNEEEEAESSDDEASVHLSNIDIASDADAALPNTAQRRID